MAKVRLILVFLYPGLSASLVRINAAQVQPVDRITNLDHADKVPRIDLRFHLVISHVGLNFSD